MTDDTTSVPENSPNAKPKGFSGSLKDYITKALNTLFTDHTSEDLRYQLEKAVGYDDSQGNSFSQQERIMIANILRFGSLRIEDVMVPRADIEAIDESASLQELLNHFDTVGHSRIPVYRETLDDPTGMVHVKDLLSWIAEQGLTSNTLSQVKSNASSHATHKASVGLKVVSGGREAKENIEEIAPFKNNDQFRLTETEFMVEIKDANILREILFVPPSMPVVNLLLRMQSTRVHLALVVDEYGGTDGLVSIEDLVEEVVGEIEDEHDNNTDNFMSGTLENGLIASARTPIEELEEKFNIDLFTNQDRDDDIDTLGGLVFSLVGRVPVQGEIITHPVGLEIEVLSADPRRIKTLKICSKN